MCTQKISYKRVDSMSIFTCAVNTVNIVNADSIQGYAMIYVTHIVQCADIIHRGKKFGQIRAGGC